MTIADMEQGKVLRGRFKAFGRVGISERIIRLAKELTDRPTYFNAIRIGGAIVALIKCARADGYWHEKQYFGHQDEALWIEHHRADVKKDAEGNVLSVEFVREESR